MISAITGVLGAFGQFFAIQNQRTKTSLESQKAATLQNYEDWKSLKDQAESDYNIKGIQQNVTIALLILFSIALLYIILKSKK